MEQNHNNIFTKSDEEIIKILARWWKMSEDELMKPFKVIASFKKSDKKDKNNREYGYFIDVRNLNGDILYYPPKFGLVKIFSVYKEGFMSSDIWQINVKLAPRVQREKYKNPFLLVLDNAIVGKPKVNFLDKLKKEKLIRKIFTETGSTTRDAKNISNALHAIMGDLYTETERFVFELLQNADDQPEEGKMVNVKLKALDENLLFLHDGKPFTEADVESISSIGDSTKKKDTEKTGYKGIGFKSVFSDAETVYIDSGNFSFAFDRKSPIYPADANMEEIPWQIKPIWEERYRLPKEIQKEDSFFLSPIGIALNVGEDKIATYNTRIPDLLSEPRFTLFLRNVGNITFVNNQDVSVVIKKKTDKNGIIQIESNEVVENWVTKDYIIDIPEETKDAIQNEKLVPAKLKEATKTKITFAAKIVDDTITPLDNAVLFTYLPTKVNDFGFKFLVNADFLTTASRESIHFKNVWNRFLFRQIGSLLLDWIKSLSDYKGSLSLLPDNFDSDDNILMEDFAAQLKDSLEKTAFIKGYKGDMLSLNDIMLDKSNFSLVVGKDLFCQIINPLKSLPYDETDDKYLRKSGLFDKIEEYTPLQVLNKITNTLLFNNWIAVSDEEQKKTLYDWLELINNDKRKPSICALVDTLPIYKFGNSYYTKSQVEADINKFVIRSPHKALRPIFEACGYECSEDIDDNSLAQFYSNNVIKSTFEYIFNHLLSRDSFKRWLNTAAHNDLMILIDWLTYQEKNNHRAVFEFVDKLPIYIFEDESITKKASEDDPNRIVINNKLETIKPLLGKMGFKCSNNIEQSPFVKLITLSKELDTFKKIKDKIGKVSLVPEEKLSLFKTIKTLEGVTDISLAQMCLFSNQTGTHLKWLSVMTSYSQELPVWMHNYCVAEIENFSDLQPYLIKEENIFVEIVKNNIDDIIKEVSLRDVYLRYKGQWTSDFTKFIINKFGATSTILDMVELQDKESQKIYLKALEKIELKANTVYPLDSYEIRNLKLAFEVYDNKEIRSFSEKVYFEGKSISTVTYSDDVNLPYHDNLTLKLSLSSLLPDYQNLGMISQVRTCLSNIEESNLNQLFAAMPMDFETINSKLDRTKQYTPEKYLFRMFYGRKLHNWYNTRFPDIELSDAPLEWKYKLLDILYQQDVKMYNTSFGYWLSSYFSGYFSSDYVMDSEKIPSFIEQWANSEEKRSYLLGVGVSSENTDLIKIRKKLVNNEVVGDAIILEKSVQTIQSILNYFIEKKLFPLNGDNQRDALLKISSLSRSTSIVINLKKLIDKSCEYSLAEYLTWKNDSKMRIFVFPNMVPKQLMYQSQVLCDFCQDYYYYDYNSQILYISEDSEVRDILYQAISNNSIPFSSSDWSKLFYDNLVSKEEVESRDQEIEQLKRELQEYKNTFGELSKNKDVTKRDNKTNPNDKDKDLDKKEETKQDTSDKQKDEDPTIKKGKGQEIPKSEQISAQLEAQIFLKEEMPEWNFPPHYGEYNPEEGKPYHFSTVEVKDSQGNPILIVLKSYKKQDEPFKINPTEWESIIKDSAYLLIYTGDDIKRITKEDLVKNQSNISLSFSTENLDIEDRISAFCSSLHYFKELHFDFKSFNLSESAESIKNIFKKNEGTQNSNTEDDI